MISVLLVHWNTTPDLADCLQALREHPYTGAGGQEIIVVDNASTDGAAQMVRERFPEVRLLENAKNELYAHGVNQAAGLATGDLLLLLNPDATVQAGTLDTLAAFLESKPDAAAVAPKLVSENGETQASVRGVPTPTALVGEFLFLSCLFPKSQWASWRLPAFDYDNPGEAPQPMASCFLVRRDAWKKVGGMDEAFPLYFNDADWCLRAYQAGYRIYYTPDAVATHGYGGTTKTVRKAAVWESRRAMLRFLGKHYASGTPAFLTALITLEAWARTGRWGQSLGKWGGITTPDGLRGELEREKRSV